MTGLISQRAALMESEQGLPPGWRLAPIGEVCLLNPRRPTFSGIADDLPVTFVPMAAVDAESGAITQPEVRPFVSVRRGFTAFQQNDVIFAKITPCMENGKAAIAHNLENGLGFGSTEFHVLRCTEGRLPAYLHYFVRQAKFRREAESHMTGTVGQKRLPAEFIASALIPLPPLPEQREIVTVLDAAFARLDAARARLARVPEILKRYRASVLKAACEGLLVPTEAELARAEGRDYEPAEALLARLTPLSPALSPLAGERARRRGKVREDKPLDTSDLPDLPEAWCWVLMRDVSHIQGGIQKQPSRAPRDNKFPFLRVANVLRGRLDLGEVHMIELFGGELEKLRLQSGDLLIVEGNGSVAEIGRMAVWSEQTPDCVHQNHIIRARPLGGILPGYLESYWNSPAGSHAITRLASSTSGLFTLSVDKVGRIPVPLPPLAEQRGIVAEVERLLGLAEAVEARVERATAQVEQVRQALLAQSFRGELGTLRRA